MRKSLYLKTFIMISFFSGSVTGIAQNINVEDFVNLKKKKKLKLNGGISANATYFSSNETGGRQPFTYQLNGNLNINILELINIPLAVNLNNYGSNFSYPSLPNRFSIHPSYQWIKTHIGDVSMSFSPYTLNGHLFTGGGVELTPDKWIISLMGGRLMRKVDHNSENPNIQPSYNRYGYGLKTRYNGNKFFIGGSFFTAKDEAKEISFQADSMGIFPKSNVAVSIEAGISIIKNLKFSVEYAFSLLTRDTRSPFSGHTLIDKVIQRKESTNFYYAVKSSLDYTFFKNTIGIGYERINPQYETLGAYYFNNDYENLTLNYARPLFEDKLTIAFTLGMQRDDLDNSKESKNIRFVGSGNINFTPTEKLSMVLSGSTFQGYKTIKSQFDYINQTTPYENLDTLNFTQLSQNLDFNLSWKIYNSETLNQNIIFFAAYQEAADKQGSYILPGNLTRFFNGSTTYSLEITSINANINAGFNISNNYSNLKNFLTFGPVLAANIRLFQKQLMTGLTFSYNRSQEKGSPMVDVFNCRWNLNYRFFKQHGLQSDLLFQQRNLKTQSPEKKVYSLTATLSYIYSF